MSFTFYTEEQIHALSPEKLDGYQSITARHITQMPESERAPYLKVIDDCKKVRAYRQRVADQRRDEVLNRREQ